MLKNVLGMMLCLLCAVFLSACGKSDKSKKKFMACDAPENIEFIEKHTQNIIKNAIQKVAIVPSHSAQNHRAEQDTDMETYPAQKNQISLNDFQVAIKDIQRLSFTKDKKSEESECRATTEITFSGSLNGLKAEQYETIYHIYSDSYSERSIELVNDKHDYLDNLLTHHLYKQFANHNNALAIQEYTPQQGEQRKKQLEMEERQKALQQEREQAELAVSKMKEKSEQPKTSHAVTGERELQSTNRPSHERQVNSSGERPLKPVERPKNTNGQDIDDLF